MLDRPPRQPPSRPSRHALRNRAHRQRQRAGEAVAPVRYNGRILNGLIRSRWLDSADCGDRQQIGEAIHRMLSEAFRDCD